MAGMYPSIIYLTGGTIILISIFFIVLVKKYLKEQNKKNLALIGLTIIIIVTGIIIEAYMVQDYLTKLNHHYLEYSVEMNSTSEENEIIYVPVSADRDLQNSIDIVSGTGEIDIIESEHGICLEINFTGNIVVLGTIDINDGIGSHDLTMKNRTRPNLDPNVELWEQIEYWIYYESCNSPNNNCSLRFSLIHETYDWWESHEFNGDLNGGWNTYWAGHEALS